MTPERWQQVKVIFNAALEREPGQRAEFLNSACASDSTLRSEVEALISSHEQSGTFIDAPAYVGAAESLVDRQGDLKPGQRVASYEIISFISRGGMGEVYLAQDQRLTRRVALKILPASLTREVDRLRRFEQEARAASALNHPNIITIYEIAEVGPTHVIATEFVEGQTLRTMMAGSRLELSQALHIAIQIADALTAAHKAGIVHRDIKPENVMLRPDGYVKLLDFGLAKLVEHSTEAVAAEAPTRQVRTGSGVVIGTAGYMSPEQARGKDVDARSDIFSLGAVIYEMVSGRRPFEGETPSDILASILRSEPAPLEQLIPGAPPELIRIIDKSLRKDREVRYQVVKDLMLDLKSLKEDLEFETRLERSVAPDFRRDSARIDQTAAATSPVPTTPVAPERTQETRSGINRVWIFGAIATAVVLAGVAVGLYKWFPFNRRASHFESIHISRLTTSRNIISTAISGDGKYVAYIVSDKGQQSLWLRQVTAANDIQIVPPSAAQFWGITFTRDASEIYYVLRDRDNQSSLYRMPFLGGTPTKLMTKIDSPVTFSPDGKRLAFVRGAYPTQEESALIVANIDGSAEHLLAKRKLPSRFYPLSFTGPSWSPDGNLIAASSATFSKNTDNDLYAFNVSDGKEQRLTPHSWAYIGRVEWLHDMTGLMMVAGEKRMPGSFGIGQIWYLSYPKGKERKITNDLTNEFRSLSLTHDSSKLVTGSLSDVSNIFVVTNGDSESAQQIVALQSRGGVSWTPDGRIVYSAAVGTSQNIWIVNADGSNRKQLTAEGVNFTPAVSPDGRYIVFASTRGGEAPDLWLSDLEGGNVRRLSNNAGALTPSWSPDGKWVFYTRGVAPAGSVWKISVDGGTPIQVTTGPSYRPTISPDGKLMACMHATPETASASQPVFKITIFSIEGGPPLKMLDQGVNTTTLDILQWTPDSRAVTYNIMKNNASNLWRFPIDGSGPVQLTNFKEQIINDYSYSADGKSLACVRGVLVRDVVLITDAQ